MCVEQLDEDLWLTRPLTPIILDAASKNVKYLCQLRSILVEKMIAGMGLYAGLQYYLGSLRDASDKECEEVKCYYPQ